MYVGIRFRKHTNGKKVKELLKRLAKENGLTLSAYIRIKLLEATKGQPEINLKQKK